MLDASLARRGASFVLFGALILAGCGADSTPEPEKTALGREDANAAKPDAAADAGSTTDCKPLPCPSGAPWDPDACSCRTQCNFPEFFAALPAGKDPVDCGRLSHDAEPSALAQAQRCALDALAAKQPFQLISSPVAEDSLVHDAYAWQGEGQLVSIFHHDSAGGGIGEKTCASLKAMSGCTPNEDRLCLECEGLVESSVACRPYNVSEADDCHGIGNYQVGKEGGYKPCCQGLREVFHKSAAHSDEKKVCDYPPLNVYACVEGRCGDGRCEAPEAAPCACPQDCPSAVWEGPANP